MAEGRLAEFLSAALARDFAWGRHDCMLFAADWALALTGRDPAAPWRGTYSDEAGARAIIQASGGPIKMVQDALDGCGWSRVLTIPNREGDIVLCLPPHHSEPMAGIITASGRVALQMHGGLVVWPVPTMWAWRNG
jgi:uncharacterized protein DUF6950